MTPSPKYRRLQEIIYGRPNKKDLTLQDITRAIVKAGYMVEYTSGNFYLDGGQDRIFVWKKKRNEDGWNPIARIKMYPDKPISSQSEDVYDHLIKLLV